MPLNLGLHSKYNLNPLRVELNGFAILFKIFSLYCGKALQNLLFLLGVNYFEIAILLQFI